MSKRTFCFTKSTEMGGILGSSSWAKSSMREAINMGIGPWFCLFVDGKFRVAVEMGQFLIKLGFANAYEYAKQEQDSAKLAKAALDWRGGKMDYAAFLTVRTNMELKYARNFESNPLIVAGRLAADNPSAVASAACLDCVQTSGLEDILADTIIEYARKTIRL